MKFEVEKLPKKEYRLKITIEAEKVIESYNHVVEEMAKETEIKGFRKGGAPQHLVESSLDKSKVRGEVINHLVPPAYDQAIKELHLRPILLPKVELIEYEENKDLVFLANTCEAPEVILGDYKSQITNLKSQNTQGRIILGPGGQPITPPKSEGDEEESKIDKILSTILDSTNIEICDLLLNEEVNHMLSRLVDQTGRLGLTIDQYLLSLNKDVEALKKEYRQSAEKTLKLEFLLSSVGQSEEISVNEAEIEQAIQAAPDEASRKNLDEPNNRAYIKSVLFKNKTIQKLLEYTKWVN